MSNHVNDAIRAGSRVEVMPPFGSFVLAPDPRRRRTLYLIGAGSGITPLYAMLRSVLKAEPWSAVHLLYGIATARRSCSKENCRGCRRNIPDGSP